VIRRKKMRATPELKSLPHCTFCGIGRDQVTMLVAGPGVHICDACVALCNRLLTGKPTAAFAGWKSLADDELLAALPASAAAVDAVEEKLREHVTLLRERGLSWERIAAALGVTRQAAWERFSRES
jgi:ClpX C4-type zinc finger